MDKAASGTACHKAVTVVVDETVFNQATRPGYDSVAAIV